MITPYINMRHAVIFVNLLSAFLTMFKKSLEIREVLSLTFFFLKKEMKKVFRNPKNYFQNEY